jgi:hypothetical protein
VANFFHFSWIFQLLQLLQLLQSWNQSDSSIINQPIHSCIHDHHLKLKNLRSVTRDVCWRKPSEVKQDKIRFRRSIISTFKSIYFTNLILTSFVQAHERNAITIKSIASCRNKNFNCCDSKQFYHNSHVINWAVWSFLGESLEKCHFPGNIWSICPPDFWNHS